MGVCFIGERGDFGDFISESRVCRFADHKDRGSSICMAYSNTTKCANRRIESLQESRLTQGRAYDGELTATAQYTMPDSSPGNIITPSGEIISPHSGLWHYTIGQRARIPGKDERWFVAKKGVGEGGKDVLIVPGS